MRAAVLGMDGRASVRGTRSCAIASPTLARASGLAKIADACARILLYWMIREVWGNYGAGALNLFQGNVGNAGGFRKRIRAFEQSSIDQEIQVAFSKALGDACRGTRDGRPGLRARYEELCDRFSYARKSKRPREDRKMRAHLIGELRALLAAVCLEALEPDLIILDEFQRFKHLLSGESDAGRLARELHSLQDVHASTRAR